MATTVPVVHSLPDIYTADAVEAQASRWKHLLSTFEERYGKSAEFVARSPGRVNVIGEHIDYSLYSVLPMAITADCLLAVRVIEANTSLPETNSYKIQIANVRGSEFPDHEFDIPYDSVSIDASVHEWTNYFKSGLRGALDLLKQKHGRAFKPKSMQIVVDGSVPVGGGLSSSAAFTTASALSVLAANGETRVDKTELTELAIVSERNVGVNSGGMDQSASVFAERGSALFVSFSPWLTALPVMFPKTTPEICFLIAQTFVAADKYVTGPVNYNLRVVECTLAAEYLNAVLNPAGSLLPNDASPLGVSLRGFQELYFSLRQKEGKPIPAGAKDQLQEVVDLVDKSLAKSEGYSREEIASVLGITVDELHDKYMTRFPVRTERFKLQQRAHHVFCEALRVLEFMDVLKSDRPAGLKDTSNLNSQLGALLSESQSSCRDLYDCSCPEIDQLCDIALKMGSYGSRLTGAGWGGCTIHLVPADKASAIKEAWEREYYSKLHLSTEQRENSVIVTRPGSGSAIFMLGSN